jgi:hypothetical protein
LSGAVLWRAHMLKYALPCALFTLSAAAAYAVPGGPIDVLAPAAYQCEMPGDATGPAGYRVQAEDFTIVNSNTYYTAKGRGTYLLTGNLLVLTSGPKRGHKYTRISDNFLRKQAADGKDSALRCVRRVINNSGGTDCTDPISGAKQARCEAPAQPASST